MPFLTICRIALLLGFSVFLGYAFANKSDNAKREYSLELAPRGIIFSAGKNTNTPLMEARLCAGDYCLFVEKRELDLLNIDLGENAQQIFATLNKMDDLDRGWIFRKIQFLERQR